MHQILHNQHKYHYLMQRFLELGRDHHQNPQHFSIQLRRNRNQSSRVFEMLHQYILNEYQPLKHGFRPLGLHLVLLQDLHLHQQFHSPFANQDPLEFQMYLLLEYLHLLEEFYQLPCTHLLNKPTLDTIHQHLAQEISYRIYLQLP